MSRIITGQAKGKRLKTAQTDATRPTSERIKEAMFSSIQFDIEGRRVLDLFAGCGQLGLEAMSRGACSVMFVDAAREAVDLVKENARTCGYFEKCRYLAADYRNYLRKAAGTDPFHLIFLDPPYEMRACADCVERILNAHLAAPGALFVLECAPQDVPDYHADTRFTVLKCTRYGKKTALCILQYHGENGEQCYGK